MDTTIAGTSHDRGELLTEPAPTAPSALPQLTGFAAGATGAALLVAGVWGLHAISGGVSAGAVALLLAAFTALGKGITLLARALAPLSEALAAVVSGVPLLVRALVALVVGAVELWWVLRGHAAVWWAHTTGTGSGWTLISALVQVVVITAAGALLFGGAKSLAGLLVASSSGRPRPGGGEPASRSSFRDHHRRHTVHRAKSRAPARPINNAHTHPLTATAQRDRRSMLSPIK